MGRWYGKNDEPLNKYESDCIENFKFLKFNQDLIYTYEDFELHNKNVVMLTSYDTGLLKERGNSSDPIKIRLKFEKRIFDEKKLSSTYNDPFGSLLDFVSCKYVLKHTYAESLGMMINEKLSMPPERIIEELGSRFLDQNKKLKPYSSFFKTTLLDLHKRDNEYLLSDYVFCFTGIQMYSTISELIEVITKFGGRYIHVQDKSRSTALYANKRFPSAYDAKDIKSQNKELVLLHGYDPEDCIKFKANPIFVGYPHLVNSNKYNLFKKFTNIQFNGSQLDNLKIIDEIELLSALKEYRKIFESNRLVDNDCDTDEIFDDRERQIMSWIQTVHNFGGRGTKAFAMFSRIAQNPNIFVQKEPKKQMKIVFEEMAKHNVPAHVLNLAQARIEYGATNLKVKDVKQLSKKLEKVEGKYVKSSEILGSYKRNKMNDEYPCGDVDVLLTCHEGNKRKCIEEYEEEISKSLWDDIKDDADIEDAVLPIDNGNKFRKYIIYMKNDGKITPIRLDVKVAIKDQSEEHTMRLHQTGSSVFNTFMSNVAKEKGYKYSQLGLKNLKNDQYIKVKDEKQILKILLENDEIVDYFYLDLTKRNKKEVWSVVEINSDMKNSKLWNSVPIEYKQ